MYDITRYTSFVELRNYWVHQVTQKNKEILIYLCGNKKDLKEFEEVTTKDAENFTLD